MVALVSNELIQIASSFAISKVIDKFRNIRGQWFFDQFIKELRNSDIDVSDGPQVDIALRRVLKDEKAQEVFYEAYRLVCLSASKKLGPIIIGMIAGKVIIEDRMATEEEEIFIQLATEMSDRDFSDYCNFYQEKMMPEKLSGHKYLILKKQDILKSDDGKQSQINPPALANELGIWAVKLDKYGVFNVETHYMNPPKYGVYDANATYTFRVVVNDSQKKLYEIIRRAQGPDIA